MSVILAIVATYVLGESADWWDIYDGTDPVDGDELAAWVAAALYAGSLFAWGVEMIAQAIRGAA